ncbi:MAG: hypothetical protein Faunusvirus2_34 [Faunusvirus sp.]|jgi:hypothetical protein|uniref:Uncharacterized protein n=1 Tax=Faunusvirus sp. TaxID=2487766 RepID=A0A3G4ZW16_9VIRU|nr:MAG: hypothetical protein Faunusvirus2_34 [Faunusvirus sp.]
MTCETCHIYNIKERLDMSQTVQTNVTIFNRRDLIVHVTTFMQQLDIFKLCLVSCVTRKIILSSREIPLYHQIKSIPLHYLIDTYHLETSILRNNIDIIDTNPYIKSLFDQLNDNTKNHELLKQYCVCKYDQIPYAMAFSWPGYCYDTIKRGLTFDDTPCTNYYETNEGTYYAANNFRKIIQRIQNTGCNICAIRNTFLNGDCFECIHIHKFKPASDKIKSAELSYYFDNYFKRIKLDH